MEDFGFPCAQAGHSSPPQIGRSPPCPHPERAQRLISALPDAAGAERFGNSRRSLESRDRPFSVDRGQRLAQVELYPHRLERRTHPFGLRTCHFKEGKRRPDVSFLDDEERFGMLSQEAIPGGGIAGEVSQLEGRIGAFLV